MKKNIIIVISLIIIIAVLTLVLIFLKNDEPQINYTDDEIKFKDEYEVLNGIELEENYVLKTIDIDSDNNVKYVKDNEILDLLTKGTNVIYFGWPDCNWCRTIVPTLITTLKENNIDTLYYYNFKSLRNSYENNNDEEKIKLYESIIEIIGEDINTVFDENSTRNGKKKILAPTVVFIKDGSYVGIHIKSVNSQINSTDLLTKEQTNELKSIYQNLINKLNIN